MSRKNTDENFRIYTAIERLRRETHALAVLQLASSIRLSGQNTWDAEKCSREAASMVEDVVKMVSGRTDFPVRKK